MMILAIVLWGVGVILILRVFGFVKRTHEIPQTIKEGGQKTLGSVSIYGLRSLRKSPRGVRTSHQNSGERWGGYSIKPGTTLFVMPRANSYHWRVYHVDEISGAREIPEEDKN